jgi:hypothetical protein
MISVNHSNDLWTFMYCLDRFTLLLVTVVDAGDGRGNLYMCVQDDGRNFWGQSGCLLSLSHQGQMVSGVYIAFLRTSDREKGGILQSNGTTKCNSNAPEI